MGLVALPRAPGSLVSLVGLYSALALGLQLPTYPGPGKLRNAPGWARLRASSGHRLDSVVVQMEPLPLACCLSCTSYNDSY